MKLLLLCGADPECAYRSIKARDQPGAKNIHQWLGVTWDELVEQFQSESRLGGGG